MLFSQVWSLGLLCAYLAIPFLFKRIKITSTTASWIIILGVAFTVRFLPAMVMPAGAGYDIESYSIVGTLVRDGKDVYTSPEAEKRHPYLPLQMYWSALSSRLANNDYLAFIKIVKIEPILADVAIALVIFASLKRTFPLEIAMLGGMLYAVNPISIYVSAYHGQFDATAALAVLLALYWLTNLPWLSGLILGVGILLKSWPVLALPSLLMGIKIWKNKILFLFLAGLILLVGVLFYSSLFDAKFTAVIERAISYNSGIGIWGYTYFFKLLAYLQPAWSDLFGWLTNFGRFITLAGLAAAWWFRARKESPQEGILTILVAFFAISHAFSIQYLSWLIPFAILSAARYTRRDLKWLTFYTITAFLYMFIAYNTLVLQMTITKVLPWPQADLLIIIPAGIPAWIVCIAWAIERVFKPKLDQQTLGLEVAEDHPSSQTLQSV
ncbi:MAG: hypothetical protein H6Q37_420 [Chloroflexi bacterium]|nr:hypothetical protein [Chloroflexota bacterium]